MVDLCGNEPQSKTPSYFNFLVYKLFHRVSYCGLQL
jgi:hypothetical protein